MKATIKIVPLVLLGSLLAMAVQAAEATSSAGLPGFCQVIPGANRWQGFGVGPGATDDWETPANWTQGVPQDDDVCIPSGGQPRIDAGQEEHLRTLDVANGATVHVDEGGKLFLWGSQSAGKDSVVRRGGRLEVVGGTLGGISHLHVLGTLLLRNNGPGAAATVLTRECTYFPAATNPYPGEDDCSTPRSDPTFLVEVDDYGLLDVQSVVANGGVNLGDQSRFIVRGTLRVGTQAYVAADHGVRVALRPHRTSLAGTGTLRFLGDGGFLEGKIESDTGIESLASLDNRGLVVKAGGSGTTLLSADYTQPSPGRVTVLSGTLLLPSGPVSAAFVGSGATYGTGRCAPADNDDPSCQPTTLNRNGYRQSADLRVPATGDTGANVRVRQLGAKSDPTDLGYPYVVHATSLTASTGNPAIIRMRFDSTILAGKTAATVKVYRQATTSAPYRYVKACSASNLPPAGEKSCVDRDASAAASTGLGGDVVMIVRTSTTSRWVGR